MLTYAIILFGIAAVGGMVLASRVLTERLAPWPLSLLHAGLGAAGLLILVYLVAAAGMDAVILPLVILVVAALGGFYLASFHLKRKVAPKPAVVIHAGVAVVGFGLLLGGFMGWI